MLYVVGDSNAVFTSAYFLKSGVGINTEMARKGCTTTEVLALVNTCCDRWRRQAHQPGRLDPNLPRMSADGKTLENATAFFVFVGLNDRTAGTLIAANIDALLLKLNELKGVGVPMLLAPPFCAVQADKMCQDRVRAFIESAQTPKHRPFMGVKIITPHLKSNGLVPHGLLNRKEKSTQLDPLHLNARGYKLVADIVNTELATIPKSRERNRKVAFETASRGANTHPSRWPLKVAQRRGLAPKHAPIRRRNLQITPLRTRSGP